jgi:hypothetical protein
MFLLQIQANIEVVSFITSGKNHQNFAQVWITLQWLHWSIETLDRECMLFEIFLLFIYLFKTKRTKTCPL